MTTPVGKVQVGKRYYFIIHAYHHVIADVVEITGKREVVTGPNYWIYSCKRDWTLFFKDGAKEDTVFRIFPPGEFEYIAAFVWEHDFPSKSA